MRDHDDEPEATEFISHNRGLMRRVAIAKLRQLGHPDPLSYADDVVIEACAIFVSKKWAWWHSPMGALIKITRRVAHTYARKHLSRRETDLESIDVASTRNGDPGGSPAEIVERANLVELATRVLNEKELDLFVLRYKYGNL
jgi:DNA-directed RNA polymerase specialized sigma24 family protein